MNTSPESATTPPIVGELRLCAWTGTGWFDYSVNMEAVMQVLVAQHAAIDRLFAEIVIRDKAYRPSEQPEFAAAKQGLAIIEALKPRPTE